MSTLKDCWDNLPDGVVPPAIIFAGFCLVASLVVAHNVAHDRAAAPATAAQGTCKGARIKIEQGGNSVRVILPTGCSLNRQPSPTQP
jgi:hypothetical protein